MYFFTADSKEKFELNPRDIMVHLRKLYAAEKEVINSLFPVLQNKPIENPIDIFFVEVSP